MNGSEIAIVLCILACFVVVLWLLAKTSRYNWSLARKVFIGLLAGVVFGLVMQLLAGGQERSVAVALDWINIVGNGYIYVLQMIIMPLVFVSILSGIAKLHDASVMGKISTLVIGCLLLTTFLAAVVGVLITHFFGLTADGLIQGTAESQRLELLQDKYVGQVHNLSIPQLLLSLLPQNVFLDLSGARATSVIAVVIFSAFLGVAAIRLKAQDEVKGNYVLTAIDTVQSWVIWLVRLVIQLTPYGVMALVIKMVAGSDIQAIIKLGAFVLVSYVGLVIMFAVHALFLTAARIRPSVFLRKVWPVLTFAFVSRSSAAAIPLSIEVQTQRLGIPESIASVAASLGATIGQNGCAGLYPAMLAAMIAPTMGINPLDPMWLLTLAVVVTLSSAGIAGVGGGATFAALVVLPIMGFPITLVALLISVEPLIDMGRTALNVNGSMLAGTLTSQIMGETDKSILNAQQDSIIRTS